MAGDGAVIGGLNGLLADATVFYQKLRHYHWNVEGRHFFELHTKFEQIYDHWAGAIDEIAERVLMVGGVPLHTLASMLEATHLAEDESTPDAARMVEAVIADLEAIHAATDSLIEQAESAGDRGTVNLIDGLRDAMEKDLWMLRSWRRETAGAWS